ncbi:MAG: YbgC/FadM family acyl-CoA thioesterase [Pseudomonadota bacterium]
MEIRVYYEDTDCGGVVYYANYLKYFERARTEFVRKRGKPFSDYIEKGIGFVVVRAEVDYRFPAKYDDVLDITTTVSNITGASFVMEYSVHRKVDQRLVVSGMTKLACINKDGKPIRIPDNLVNTLSN